MVCTLILAVQIFCKEINCFHTHKMINKWDLICDSNHQNITLLLQWLLLKVDLKMKANIQNLWFFFELAKKYTLCLVSASFLPILLITIIIISFACGHFWMGKFHYLMYITSNEAVSVNKESKLCKKNHEWFFSLFASHSGNREVT